MSILICKEMQALRDWLDGHGIAWQDRSDPSEKFTGDFYGTARTKFKIGSTEYSVINGFGTFGGHNGYDLKDQGLLELMIDWSEPIGYLTATDIIKMIGERK